MLMASGEMPTPDTEAGAVPSVQIIDAAFEQTDINDLQTTDQVLRACIDHIGALDNLLIDRVGAAAAPNFSRLELLLQQMQSKTAMYMANRGYGSDAAPPEQDQADMQNEPDAEGVTVSDPQAGTDQRSGTRVNKPGQVLSGEVTSNQDVLKALDMIINHYEQREPSSPVPLLIKRAKRLVGKSFVDIIRDLSPDAMSQVQMVSGDKDLPED